jgi:hypothetical protein
LSSIPTLVGLGSGPNRPVSGEDPSVRSVSENLNRKFGVWQEKVDSFVVAAPKATLFPSRSFFAYRGGAI